MYPDLSLDIEAKKFSSEGFDILFENEYFPFQRFFDVGAIVFYAKIMEWEFPGFTVDSCFDRLRSLQGILSEQGYIESFEHRFMIVAQNNK